MATNDICDKYTYNFHPNKGKNGCSNLEHVLRLDSRTKERAHEKTTRPINGLSVCYRAETNFYVPIHGHVNIYLKANLNARFCVRYPSKIFLRFCINFIFSKKKKKPSITILISLTSTARSLSNTIRNPVKIFHSLTTVIQTLFKIF